MGVGVGVFVGVSVGVSVGVKVGVGVGMMGVRVGVAVGITSGVWHPEKIASSTTHIAVIVILQQWLFGYLRRVLKSLFTMV